MKHSNSRKFSLANVLVVLVALIGFMKTNNVAAQATTSLTITTSSDPSGLSGFFYYGDIGQFHLDDGGSRSQEVSAGTISVYQSLPQGIALDIDCGSAATTLIDNGKGVAVDVADGENVVCNFHNREVGGTITVVNASSSDNSYFYYGEIGQFNLSNGQSNTVTNYLPGDYTIYQSILAGEALDVTCTGGTFTAAAESVTVTLPERGDVICTFDNIDVGGSISITNLSAEGSFDYFGSTGQFSLVNGQTNSAENLLTGEYTIAQVVPSGILLDIACDSPNVTVTDNGMTVNLAVNEDVHCTFTNTDVGGSITVIAAGDAADGPFTYYGAFGIIEAGLGTVLVREDLYPGEYDLYQSTPAGFLFEITCVGADSTPIERVGVKVLLAANEDVTCTFTNDDVGGSITVIAAGDAADEPFNFYGAFGIVASGLGQVLTRGDLYPGSYDLYQSLPAGYAVDIDCVGGDATPVEGQLGVTVALDANEDIICTFTNSDVGSSITVIAETVPAGMTDLNFYGSFGLFSLDDGDSDLFDNLYAGDYQLFQDIPADGELAIDCGDANAVGTEDGKGITVALVANQAVTCTFTTLTYDPNGDPDGDGLTNDEELNVFGTDPFDFDSDDDGESDGAEVAFLRGCVFAQDDGGDAVKIEEFATVHCNISSNGKADLKKNTTVNGSVSSYLGEVILDDYARVYGDLLAAKKIETDHFSEVFGSVTSNDTIKLKHDASVTGNLTAADKIEIEENAYVGGTVNAFTTVPATVPLQLVNFTVVHGDEDIEVKRETPVTLAPGVYGKLKVESAAMITLGAGEYVFKEFVVDNDAVVNLDLNGGELTIYVSKKVELKDRVEMVLVGDAAAENVLFLTTDEVKLGKEGRYVGTYFTPQHKAELNEHSTLVGALYGDKVHLKKQGTLIAEPAIKRFVSLFVNG